MEIIFHRFGVIRSESCSFIFKKLSIVWWSFVCSAMFLSNEAKVRKIQDVKSVNLKNDRIVEVCEQEIGDLSVQLCSYLFSFMGRHRHKILNDYIASRNLQSSDRSSSVKAKLFRLLLEIFSINRDVASDCRMDGLN